MRLTNRTEGELVKNVLRRKMKKTNEREREREREIVDEGMKNAYQEEFSSRER